MSLTPVYVAAVVLGVMIWAVLIAGNFVDPRGIFYTGLHSDEELYLPNRQAREEELQASIAIRDVPAWVRLSRGNDNWLVPISILLVVAGAAMLRYQSREVREERAWNRRQREYLEWVDAFKKVNHRSPNDQEVADWMSSNPRAGD